MKGSYDIMIVGIGGQGTILASNILGEACLIEGRSVRGAETHGMAQRGGSVESHVRIDGKFGPLVAPGTADLLIGFDMLEGLRYSHFLKPEGKMVVSRGMVIPTSVFVQGLAIPSEEDIIGKLSWIDLCLIDAEGVAREAGSVLAANVVMLGAASHHIPLAEESLVCAVQRLVPQKTIEINTRAFAMGRKAGENC
ncbi:MAG: indolepyruvate oxidoreductase subunit beta [Methanoregulaceae archaeon]|jgi:indolepyruvate ferredoxin oxidoreductase beta subunit|nr:indolepyruvate oxidoreductase subunit beta [Methanoregulaceae archaeon]